MNKSQYPYRFNPQQAILKEGFSFAQNLFNSSRIGRIISIDYEKDPAIAKAENSHTKLARVHRLFFIVEIRRVVENCP